MEKKWRETEQWTRKGEKQSNGQEREKHSAKLEWERNRALKKRLRENRIRKT